MKLKLLTVTAVISAVLTLFIVRGGDDGVQLADISTGDMASAFVVNQDHHHGNDQAGAAPESGLSQPQALSPEKASRLWFAAARAGRADILQGLLEAGAPVDGRNRKGYTAFILAAYNNQAHAIELLIAHGADPCAQDHKGNSAQMGVAFKGHDDMALRLLGFGCDPDHANASGQTAIMMAALFGRTRQVRELRANGASVSATDIMGNTALLLARIQGNDEIVALISP